MEAVVIEEEVSGCAKGKGGGRMKKKGGQVTIAHLLFTTHHPTV